eukprot:403347688
MVKILQVSLLWILFEASFIFTRESIYNSDQCLRNCIDANKRYCPGDSTMTWGFCCESYEDCPNNYLVCSNKLTQNLQKYWLCPFESYCGSSAVIIANSTKQYITVDTKSFVTRDVCNYRITFPESGSYDGDTITIKFLKESSSTDIKFGVGTSITSMNFNSYNVGDSISIKKPDNAYISVYATSIIQGQFTIEYQYFQTGNKSAPQTFSSGSSSSGSKNSDENIERISEINQDNETISQSDRLVIIICCAIMGLVLIGGLIFYFVRRNKKQFEKAKLYSVQVQNQSEVDQRNIETKIQQVFKPITPSHNFYDINTFQPITTYEDQNEINLDKINNYDLIRNDDTQKPLTSFDNNFIQKSEDLGQLSLSNKSKAFEQLPMINPIQPYDDKLMTQRIYNNSLSLGIGDKTYIMNKGQIPIQNKNPKTSRIDLLPQLQINNIQKNF